MGDNRRSVNYKINWERSPSFLLGLNQHSNVLSTRPMSCNIQHWLKLISSTNWRVKEQCMEGQWYSIFNRSAFMDRAIDCPNQSIAACARLGLWASGSEHWGAARLHASALSLLPPPRALQGSAELAVCNTCQGPLCQARRGSGNRPATIKRTAVERQVNDRRRTSSQRPPSNVKWTTAVERQLSDLLLIRLLAFSLGLRIGSVICLYFCSDK